VFKWICPIISLHHFYPRQNTVSEIAKHHLIQDEKYADDKQLILAFKPKSQTGETDAYKQMEKCIEEIKTFLSRNKLCTNSDKTEFLIIGSKKQLNLLNTRSISIDDMT
jgi:hypothetical protein